MMYYCNEASVAAVNIKDGNSSTIVKLDKSSNGWRFIASFDESIYFTDSSENSVSCFSVKGGKLWEFKDDNIIQGPSGIVVDRYGIIYVALGLKHCIVAISPNGKRVVDFISTADGIEEPVKLFYDNKRDLLLVTGKAKTKPNIYPATKSNYSRQQLLETKPPYSMRKNKKHKIRKTKDASDSSDDGSGPTCNHVNMSVNFVQMKKGLSTQTFGECLVSKY
ncbi:unnamed protein product [Mytilus coruscus]|uniref:Uncharacterized protein n=1 Tax=Mytilus coruscus TaxID=42192 RepID=A0A6J8E6G9_MYTCO|nr:unnamed protein product [Mytilus coruscus]